MNPDDDGTGPFTFREALEGLGRGDFSRLEPLFISGPDPAAHPAPVIRWHRGGRFRDEPKALAEALTCACFLGRTEVSEYLLDAGVDPVAGAGTGLDALHWAVNRGQLATVQLLLGRTSPRLETRNMHGATVLGTAVWSAIHEPRPDHPAIIDELLRAGARAAVIKYPTGSEEVDAILRRHGVSTMMAKRVTPILNVSDIQQSFAWFEKLGWTKAWEWGDPPGFGAVCSGDCEIFLCLDGQGGRGRSAVTATFGAEGDDAADKGAWMSIWVDDVDAVHQQCLEHALEVTWPPTDMPWNVREMHVRHPDGHVFRISRGLEEDDS